MRFQAGGGGGEEQRRGKAPWWVWVLAGCGGLMLLGVVAVVTLGFLGWGWLRGVEHRVGPITVETAQASLSDVPWYPGAELDEETTRSIMLGSQMVGELFGEAAGPLAFDMVALTTPDSPEAVREYYRRTHAAGEWGAGFVPMAMPEHESPNTVQFESRTELIVILANPADAGNGTLVQITRMPLTGGSR